MIGVITINKRKHSKELQEKIVRLCVMKNRC